MRVIKDEEVTRIVDLVAAAEAVVAWRDVWAWAAPEIGGGLLDIDRLNAAVKALREEAA